MTAQRGLLTSAFISKAATAITTWSFLQSVTAADPNSLREDAAFCDAYTPVAAAAAGLAKSIRDLITTKRRAMSATASSVYDFIVAKAKAGNDSQLTAFAKETKKSRRRARVNGLTASQAEASAAAPQSTAASTRTTERCTEKVTEPAASTPTPVQPSAPPTD